MGSDSLTLHDEQNPHVARLVLSAFIGLAPEHKFRVIAPDVGGSFGSKIFIYAEETVCVWAARWVNRPVKWTADRTEAFLSDAHGRDHVSRMPNSDRRKRQDHRAARLDQGEHGRVSVDLRVVGADLSTRRCCRASTTSRRSTRRSRRSIPTPRRSTPIGAGRPEATSSSSA